MVVQSQFNQGCHTHGARQQNSMISGGDVVHINHYVVLEQAISNIYAYCYSQKMLTECARIIFSYIYNMENFS